MSQMFPYIQIFPSVTRSAASVEIVGSVNLENTFGTHIYITTGAHGTAMFKEWQKEDYPK